MGDRDPGTFAEIGGCSIGPSWGLRGQLAERNPITGVGNQAEPVVFAFLLRWWGGEPVMHPGSCPNWAQTAGLAAPLPLDDLGDHAANLRDGPGSRIARHDAVNKCWLLLQKTFGMHNRTSRGASGPVFPEETRRHVCI